MKIDQEKFNKLSQLDRIEFRQKRTLIFMSFLFFGIVQIISIILVIFSKSLLNKFLFLLVIILIWFINNLSNSIYERELMEEYFKVEARKK